MDAAAAAAARARGRDRARRALAAGGQGRASGSLNDLRDGLGSDAYWRQRTWKKVAVIFAGPGRRTSSSPSSCSPPSTCAGVPVETTRTVDTVLAALARAARRACRPDDRIVAIDGTPVAPDRISETIRASEGRPLRLTVVRDGGSVDARARSRPERTEGVYRLGFALAPRYERYGPVESTRLALEATWEVTKGIGGALGRLVTGENREEVSSAVGIVQGSSQALEAGFRYYLQVLALISLSLALLNLLPLLPLDGGHITFSIIEGIRGRALGREVYERVSLVGIALVLFLFAIGLTNDINRLNGG